MTWRRNLVIVCIKSRSPLFITTNRSISLKREFPMGLHWSHLHSRSLGALYATQQQCCVGQREETVACFCYHSIGLVIEVSTIFFYFFCFIIDCVRPI